MDLAHACGDGYSLSVGWKDRLLQASFRGVAFSVQEHEAEGGRALSVHEFPFRDEVVAEDLGRLRRRYGFSAFILGEDYAIDRDRLLRALELPGPGLLVHPYLGAALASVESFRVRETTAEGRMARFELAFLEVEGTAQVTVSKPRAAVVEEKATAMSFQAAATLEAEFDTSGVPQPALTAATAEVAHVGYALQALGALGTVSELSAELAGKARQLILEAQALALSPLNCAAAIRDALDSVWASAANAAEALRAYENLERFTPSFWPGTKANANAEVLTGAVRSLALAGWARALAEFSWTSYEEAIEARDKFLARLEARTLESSRADYLALRDLAGVVSSAVPPEGEDLPRLVTLTLRADRPALVVAYMLYRKARLSEEVARRNRVRNPLFMPAGQALEVLSTA